MGKRKTNANTKYRCTCNCGGQFVVSKKHLGKSVKCTKCGVAVQVPRSLGPNLKIYKGKQPWKLDWRFVGTGLSLAGVGLLLGMISIYGLGGGFARRIYVIPVSACVCLVMGVAFIIKGVAGKFIEWD